MICKHCGLDNPEQNEFCGKCGQPLVIEEEFAESLDVADVPQKTRAKRAKKFIIGGTIILVLVIICASFIAEQQGRQLVIDTENKRQDMETVEDIAIKHYNAAYDLLYEKGDCEAASRELSNISYSDKVRLTDELKGLIRYLESEIKRVRSGRAIQNRDVFIGMSKGDAELAWGKPEDINRTINRYSTHEQWCYSGNRYLYFDDGILTSIQD